MQATTASTGQTSRTQRTTTTRRRGLFLTEALESRRLLSTSTWVGPSGLWTTAADWSGGVVPTATSAVVINQTNSVAVTLGTSAAVGSLLLTSGQLIIAGGSLSLASGSSIGTSGSLSLSGNGSLSLASGATLSNSGGITVNPGSQMTVGGAYTATSSGALKLPSGTAGTGIDNLLQDPGFESPAGGGDNTPPDGWGQWNDAYVSTDHAHGGAESLLENGSSGVYETFDTSAGATYSASVYALNPSSSPLTGAQGAFLQIYFEDAGGNAISSPQAWVNAVTAQSPTNTWINSTASITAPSGAVSVTLCLQSGPYVNGDSSAGGSAYFDDVQFGPPAVSTATVTAGSISNSGTISIGAGDAITSNATFTQVGTGVLDVLLGGSPVENSYGTLTAGGAASLAGSFNATLVNGYSPAINDDFTLLSYASVTGGFTTVSLPSGSGDAFQSGLNPTYFGISAVPVSLTTTISAGTKIATANSNLVGVNLAYWDDLLTTTQTQQMVEAGGFSSFRFPGGAAADDFHFNVQNNYGDSAADTVPQFAQFISSVGGSGIVTVDYGSGSPQEAEAELAYLDGSTTDNTNIGSGIEWNDAKNAWQNVNWQTVAYWASLRAALPLATDDGLNFLRIDHPSVFTSITNWEIGNEQYGSWAIDHHGTAGPGGISTGANRDPATYAKFAATFAAFVTADTNFPKLKIGIDSGDPTGANDNNWTRSVITDLWQDGDVPGFISDHSYMQSPGAESDSFLLNDTVSDSASIFDWATRYGDYEAMLDSIVGSTNAAGVQMMATEFNSNPGVEGKQMGSLINGLFIADSIGSLLNSGYTGGLVWDLRNGYTTDGNNSSSLYGWREGGDEGIIGTDNDNDPPVTGPYVPYPSYFGEQIASHIMQTGGAGVSVVSSYAGLTVYSVLETNGHLDLMIINKNPDATLADQFNILGFTPSGTSSIWQYGEAQDYAQSQSATGAAALAASSPTLTVNGNNFSYTFPAYSMTVIELTPKTTSTGNLSFSGPAYYVRIDPASSTSTQIFASTNAAGSPAYELTTSSITSLSFTGLSSLTVDESDGNPVPTTAAVVATGTAASLVLDSTATVSVNASAVVANGTTINYSGFATITDNGQSVGGGTLTQTAQPTSTVTFNDAGSSNTLNISAGSYAFGTGVNPGAGLSINVGVPAGGSSASVSFGSAGIGQSSVFQLDLAGLTIYSGGVVALGARASNAGLYDHTILVLGSLNSNSSTGFGSLNLNDNDLIVAGDSLSTVTTLLAHGGIYSAVASTSTAHLTALGSMSAGTFYSNFDGVAVTASEILVKYTYLGDSNLDGVVDGTDYSRIDNGYSAKLTGWFNGDFNYDGIVNGSDYTLIDNTFNRQGSTLNSAGYTAKTLASVNSSSTGGYLYSGLALSTNQTTLSGETYVGGSGGGGTSTVKVLATFNGSNGAATISDLLMVNTTLYGTVFSVPISGGNPTTLASFAGSAGSGANPICDLVADSTGNLYGTTAYGGANDDGTLFSLSPIAVP